MGASASLYAILLHYLEHSFPRDVIAGVPDILSAVGIAWNGCQSRRMSSILWEQTNRRQWRHGNEKPVSGQVSSTCHQGQSAKQYDGRSEVSSRADCDAFWKVGCALRKLPAQLGGRPHKHPQRDG